VKTKTVNSVFVRSGKKGRVHKKSLYKWFPKCAPRNAIAFQAVQQKP